MLRLQIVLGIVLRWAIETVIRCIAGHGCSRIKNLIKCVEVYLRKFYGIELWKDVCPVCGKKYKDLYIHFKRYHCGGIIESLVREVTYIYRDKKRFCIQFTDPVYCRICRKPFTSWTDCLVHVIEEHPDYVRSYLKRYLG